jgi:hypothetical protein
MTSARFTARFDEGDRDDLRHVSYAGEEIAARIYFALRDRAWRTVPLHIVSRSLEQRSDGFVLAVVARSTWSSHPLDVDLRFSARGQQLIASSAARALGDVEHCRIGLCVLHPLANHVGRPLGLRCGTRRVEAVFPREIAPRGEVTGITRPLFETDFDRLTIELASGTRIAMAFDGDTFEMEDQRNWSDASFKTYSSPPTEGTDRRRAHAGDQFSQTITVSVEPGAAHAVDPGGDLRVRASAGEPAGGDLRVRASAGEPAGGDLRVRASASEPAGGDLVEIGEPFGRMPSVGRYRGRASARSWRPAGGFVELNHTRPPVSTLGGADAIEFGINGTVHAADDDSLMETTATHGMVIRQARDLYPGMPVHVAPLDFSDEASDWMELDGSPRSTPPSTSDGWRRHAEYAAAWIVASLACALPAAPSSMRYFAGGLGASTPAQRLLDVLSAREGRQLHAVSSPVGVAGFAISDGDDAELWLANTTRRKRTVSLPGAIGVETLPAFGMVHSVVSLGAHLDAAARTQAAP